MTVTPVANEMIYMTQKPPSSTHAVARLIDHAVLNPTAGDKELREQVALLSAWPIASFCVKPSMISLAAALLEGSESVVSTVIGFPHGGTLPQVKGYECEQAFSLGAREVDMVINLGKALDGDWAAVSRDIEAVLVATRHNKGVLKVIFEAGLLPSESKVQLCKLCSELEVDFVKTSTGFGFTKGSTGGYDSTGATDADLKLMRQHTTPSIGVKASGGIRNLRSLLHATELGVSRIGTSSTLKILKEAEERFG